ncbi:hypothetical protein HAZT_HAZT004398 [Hyalella azteca]|uniref:40S ribosomal protein S4 n=1 Tax=Hyalella azteca TaxID=294128 RepID=A0A6A0H181_HYAAZ|nr:hypothetical protein HAZT_HAZT004398 [Hyalella azteca]
MVRGPKKHLKRLCAPKSWLLDKTGGVFAPRPAPGPHKLRESIPIVLLIRNRLKYALNYDEAKKITMQRLIQVDHRVRTDPNFPAGIMDVVQIARVKENFRILYDIKGRFLMHRITEEEANFKLCKITKKFTGPKKVPTIVTSDGRTIRYPDPLIRINDTIVYDMKESKIKDFMSLEPGNLSIVTGGRNLGRIGVIIARDHHAGGFDIVRIKDAVGNVFATRLQNVFVIGKGTKAYISLPKGKGVKLTVAEERDRRLAKKK